MTPLHPNRSEASTMRNLLLSLVLSSAAMSAVAHAESIQTFDFKGTAASGAVGTGTVVTDASGQVIDGTIYFTGGTGDQTFNYVKAYPSHGFQEIAFSAGRYFIFDLDLKSTLLGLSSEAACSDEVDCKYVVPGTSGPPLCLSGSCSPGTTSPPSDGYFRSAYGGYHLSSGSLTLEEPASVTTAATPEPSSLILLGTGALGMAGAVRRRFLSRA